MSRPSVDPRWWAAETFEECPLPQVLAGRDISGLFRFLSSRGFSRAAIAGHTGLAENRVSAIMKGRQQVVTYEVLERIAAGLQIPRELMGLGFAEPPAPASPPIAICGSRRPGTNQPVIDAAVIALSRLLADGAIQVSHGPTGVGIEVLTYIANNHRPAHLRRAFGIFGHHNVVRGVRTAVVVGGGQGTNDEVDLALAAGVPLIPLNSSGGAAARAYALLAQDLGLRGWIDNADFVVLGACGDVDTIAEVTGRLINVCLEGASRA